MKCNICGENNLDDAKFCRSCGANLVQTDTPSDNKSWMNSIKLYLGKILSNKKIVIGVASAVLGVVVLITAISIIGSLMNSKVYTTADSYISYVYLPDTDKTSIFFNNNLLSSTINGKAKKVSSSTNGKIAAFISDEKVLYVVEKESINKIADDIIDAVLSYDGNIMAYTNQDRVLYTIQLNNRKIERIDDDVVRLEASNNIATFSPNGKTLMYATEKDNEYTYYIKNGSSKTKLEKFQGLCTSNNGKTIYGFIMNDDDESYISGKKLGVYDLDTDSSMKLSDSTTQYLFNYNHNEILFSFDSKYYLSINGGERIKIGNYTSLRPIVPGESLARIYDDYSVSTAKSFVGTLMMYYKKGIYGIGYIDKNYEMQEVIKNIDYGFNNPYLTEDCNTVYFTRDYSLYRATRKMKFEPEKLISDVVYYRVSPDGKKIYYVNSDQELYCHYKNKDNLIAEEVYVSSLSITDKGTVFFLTDYSTPSGVLYRCSDGKNKIRVDDDVFAVYVNPRFVYYCTTESNSSTVSIFDSIYISSNGKDFKKFADDVSFISW